MVAERVLSWEDVNERMSIDEVDKVAIVYDAIQRIRNAPPTAPDAR